MPRQPLSIGTWGLIRTHEITDANGRKAYRAITNFRDFNGKLVRVERRGKTKGAARSSLQSALSERAKMGKAGTWTPSHRFSEIADEWVREIEELVRDGSRSPGTVQSYKSVLEKHVRPALGELRLAEVTTARVDTFIRKVKTDTGVPTAKLCRSVTSGVMGLAVRSGPIAVNPVREIRRIERPRQKKLARSLTVEEVELWLQAVSENERAIRKDIPDLSIFMLGTGVRIGEALALTWSEVDLSVGMVEIEWTISRITGQGLVRRPTKSEAGERSLGLPQRVRDMLSRRFDAGVKLDWPVFPDSVGGFRDPTNTLRELRKVRAEVASLEWVKSHNFRKTLATILDDAGQSARQIADHLGHSRVSMTQDGYLGRKIRNPQVVEAMDAVFGKAVEGQPDSEKGGKGVG
ncbi:site-specific recombinase XerD [Kribbella orskensis]|uniref:Site-specific recombinase XerD n=1 Tax=Kribbella orskensis TaxID=2512216 RepID=A0ABY2BLK7_9ACTN|nr:MULTISPECIES: site-specific integrase [Kribbella]TCN41020.1 site-specific recombinase XerD [Kribbella sp. VKM Ac-2500]TCO24272.1 site-specific recombinase XerD [Kribbella orskensis]